MGSLRVTVWNEFFHETRDERVTRHYPDGMHETIAAFLREDSTIEVRTAILDQPSCGLSDEILDTTDVMVWWGHMRHGDVADEIAEKVVRRVWDGMGFIALHSSHFAKPFRRLMGTECFLQWRVADDSEKLWVVDPSHPIAAGIDAKIELDQAEMYGEWFQIPAPDEIVFISWFSGGEVFRSGCCWKRGKGRVFYFRPGHETFPIFHNEQVQRAIRNACHWAAPTL